MGNDAARGIHTDIRNQQLLFQLIKQVIINLFATEQTDKTGTEVLTGFDQAALQASKEALFAGTFLLLHDEWRGGQRKIADGVG